jgi:hypothetical protein
MKEDEKEQVKDLLKQWQEEAKQIDDISKQPEIGGLLDNGNSGKYTQLTKKYQKLIEKRLNKKIWNK